MKATLVRACKEHFLMSTPTNSPCQVYANFKILFSYLLYIYLVKPFESQGRFCYIENKLLEKKKRKKRKERKKERKAPRRFPAHYIVSGWKIFCRESRDSTISLVSILA